MSEPTADMAAQGPAASTEALPDITVTPLTEIYIPDTLRDNLARAHGVRPVDLRAV